MSKRPQNELHSREEFFQREAAAWNALTQTWVDLPEAALLLPGACGIWSVKDVLFHITVWLETARRMIEQLEKGKWAHLGMNTERFNAHHAALTQERPLAEAFQLLNLHRESLLQHLATLTEEQLLNEFGRQQIGWWAKWATYAHYEEHIPELTAHRKRVLHLPDGSDR